ncbi:MAG: glycosyl transferase family 2, partial [Candidatus Woesearchaeota archaeon]
YSCIQNINLVEKNFDIVEEILIKLVKKNKNLKIIEIPTKFSKRKFGKSKRNLVTFSLTYLKSIMRLRLHIK